MTELKNQTQALTGKNVMPTLGLISVGEDESIRSSAAAPNELSDEEIYNKH